MENNVNDSIQNENISNTNSVDSTPLNNSVPMSDNVTTNVVSDVSVNSVPVNNEVQVTNSVDSSNVVSMAEIPTTNNINNVPINAIGMNNNIDFSNDVGNYSNKSKGKVFGIIALVIVVLGLVGVFGYKTYIGKPMNLYKEAIKKTYEEVSKSLNKVSEVETFNYKEDSLAIAGDFKITSNMAEMKDYTKYNYDFNMGLDAKNKKMELGASMNEGSKEIIAAAIYLLDKTMYIDSKQAYNKVLYQVLDQDIFSSLLNVEDTEVTVDYEKIDQLVKKISEYLSDSLSDKYFRKENAKIEVDGKKVKVTKVIYNINSDSIYEIVKSILDDMKSDDEFISLFAEVSGLDKEEVKSSLKEVEISKEDFEMNGEMDFYLYTTGFIPKVIGFGLESGSTVISYADMGNFSEFSMTADGSKLAVKTVGNKSNGSFVTQGEEIFSFTLVNEITDKNVKFELSLAMNDDGQEIVLDLKTNVVEENDKKAKGTFITNLGVTENGKTKEIGAELNLNVEIGTKDIANFNKTGAVNFSTLTEKQLQQIGTNIEKALKNTSFYSIMQDTTLRVE